jgi:hypothetical protein
MALVLLPEARVARPNPLDGAGGVEASEGVLPRLAVGSEGELQATLIAFSFSAIALSSES